MPNNVYITWKYFSNNGNQKQVNIRKKGYSGLSQEPDVLQSPIIIYHPVDSMWETIRASSCRVIIDSKTEHEWREFFNADFADYSIEVIETLPATGTISWTGFFAPSNYMEPFTVPPYGISLNFVCGLSELKRQEFKESGGDLFSGQMHCIEVLRHCLNGLGEFASGPLNIVEIMNVYPFGTGSLPAGSPMGQNLRVDSGAYREIKDEIEEGMTKYDVIDLLLRSLGCFIFQKDSKWHILRVKEYTETVLTFREWLPSIGSESASSTNDVGTITHEVELVGIKNATDADFVMVDQSGNLPQRPEVGSIGYFYYPNKYQLIGDSLLKNSQFHTYMGLDEDTILPKFWTRNAGLTPGECSYFIKNGQRKGAKFNPKPRTGRPLRVIRNIRKDDVFKDTAQIKEPEYFIRWSNLQVAFDANNYIEQIIIGIGVDVGDKLAIFEELNLNPNAVPVLSFYDFFLSIDDGVVTYFLQADGSWSLQNLTLPSVFVYSNRESQSFAFISDNFPAGLSGVVDITFRKYLPRFTTNGAGLSQLPISIDISVLYKPSGDKGVIPHVTRIEEINNIHDKFDIEVFHGDGPDNCSIGSFRRFDGSTTFEWSRFTAVESLRLSDWLIDDIASLEAHYNKGWNGIFYAISDEFSLLNRLHSTLIVPPAATVEYGFVALGYTWDTEANSYTVEMDQVEEVSFMVAEEHNPSPPDDVPGDDNIPPALDLPDPGDEVLEGGGVVEGPINNPGFPG